MKKKEFNSREKLFEKIIEAIKEKKGRNIVSIDLKKIENTLFDFFVICHGNSKTQVRSIVESVELKTEQELGIRPRHREGIQNAFWILLDYEGIVVHVFLNEQREFYRLEDLWADGDLKIHKDE